MASRRKLTITCLIPEFEMGDYWDVAYKGFIDGAKSIKSYDVSTDIHLFDPNDIKSFRRESEKILQSNPAGVITNVVFADAVKEFAKKMDKADIPYAFVDQKIDGLNYQVYWGADPREAGHVVGFDDLDKNIEALNEGLVEYLVTRHTLCSPITQSQAWHQQ